MEVENENKRQQDAPQSSTHETKNAIKILETTRDTIIGLNEYLKVQRLYGGVRFMGFRMTRLLLKAMSVAYLYEVSFFFSHLINFNIVQSIESGNTGV